MHSTQKIFDKKINITIIVLENKYSYLICIDVQLNYIYQILLEV